MKSSVIRKLPHMHPPLSSDSQLRVPKHLHDFTPLKCSSLMSGNSFFFFTSPGWLSASPSASSRMQFSEWPVEGGRAQELSMEVHPETRHDGQEWVS